MTDDKRIAAICTWLRERGLELHCKGTAKNSGQAVKVCLVDKKTKIVVGIA